MYPKGTLYVHTMEKIRGEKELHAPLLIKILYKVIQLVSAGITAGIILFFGMYFYPILHAEIAYHLGTSNSIEYFDENVAVLASSTANVQSIAEGYGVDASFSIVVPKIDATSKIIANVDVASEESYMDALNHGVAHAAGSYFPGQGKSIFLFSHSTNSPLNVSRLNAVFYLLRKLETHDQILIFFADKLYEYEVESKLVVKSSDVSWLTADFGSEKLLLQTCDPPGTSINRMIIVAKLSRVIN